MDLTSKSKLIEILRRNNIFLKKSLGQNFLIDKNILKKIIDALEISKEDNILEVGCGVGTLTLELAKKAKKVIGVEIDKRFKSILEELLKDYNNVEILFEDVLK
ncbi:MAG: ribosomal RNA small subunit methyltransferase A, partial [Dictyoglomus turgidum]